MESLPIGKAGNDMDGIIAQFETEPDNDLTLCPYDGVAYQTDMKITASYDVDYFNK